MCGICGFTTFNGISPSRETLERARDVMFLRGPDAHGLFYDGKTGLGHRRLKILDLSNRANQPLGNENGTIQVVFNGEIYNFKELRQRLKAAQHQFSTETDTEVLVHGYEEWGEKIVNMLDGMFAFALWDQQKKRLLIGRDRLGQKPLFIGERNGTIYFASDIRCFLSFGFSAQINPFALDCYLQHFSPTQEHTILEKVEKVRPGEYIVSTPEGTKKSCYWKPDFREKLILSEEEWLEKIDHTFDRAVAKRLVSDVPLGFFLSGGIDSSLVVAYAARHVQKVKTFSIGFEESDFSELHYAKMVADRFGTEHHEIILKPNVLSVLTKLLAEYGEPFADASCLPTYFVSQAAGEKVTVALSGDGGDELFGGYRFHAAAYWAQKLRTFFPNWGIDSLYSLCKSAKVSNLHRSFGKIQTVLTYAHSNLHIRRLNSMAFNTHQKEKLYTSEMRNLLKSHISSHIYERYQQETESLDLLDEAFLHVLVGRLPNDYLIKVDVASMTHSLELRSPFLDRDLLALSQQIPSKMKIPHGNQKHLLKQLALKQLPAKAVNRTKQGFELPISNWLRNEWKDLVRALLFEGSLISTGWFEPSYIREIVDLHQSGKQDHTYRIWSLLCLELWYRMFIDCSLHPGDDLASLR